ncbi:hypothetical protein AOL_s00078g541 [Orbilia oligospora ATCC 24927]|uniref:EamA domain-containing protein n=1 Tax=Arthrobotrys oligospora (strain ATCC 24927 / CBS 115.81 / DSM 1491) TaxID=756982 RepID=G1XC94_ARTOA|nr:hypothetical protein AOL_s00078g541 [Orbilia oligospora ATCC 24927]EGX49508.1 hypothetical protein AOL_s00078g541 [Orbilia oligospora ATCC 24927]
MSEASQKAGARDATPASSRNKQASETAPEDSWEVEWDVYSDPASSEAEESEPGSPTALFRHTHEGPGGGRRVITAVVLMAIAALSMVGQTEATVYVQRDLGWNKPYLILYLTHGFYFIMWPGLLAFERFQQSGKPWSRFFEDHFFVLRRTAQYVEHQTLDLTSSQTSQSPLPYMLRTCFIQCCALNVAAVTWFIAANMTTPSDLTAINNTSAIFAYVFSVWLLKESMRMTKNIAVVLAVAGVLVISYGNPTEGGADEVVSNKKRLFGNIITAAGAVLFGLYRVLYKLKACLPAEATAEMNITFSVVVGSSIGVFTTLVFWLPLPILHFTGWEVFELPSSAAAFWTAFGAVSSVLFTSAFLSLTALTSPVLSSVAAMLGIFLVALYDAIFTGHDLTKATIGGGFAIIIAFLLLGWSTYQETYVENKTPNEHELTRVPTEEV